MHRLTIAEQRVFHQSLRDSVEIVAKGRCPNCNGCEWVCEFHPDKPWGDQPNSGPNACHCGGAGKPCPECNPLSKEKRG